MRYSIVALTAAVVLLVAGAPAQAAWTGDVTADAATLRGDHSLDSLGIETSGAYLSHSYAGPGFSSGIDWNSSPVITEFVPLSAQLHVVIEGGGDDDLLRVGNGTTSADEVPFPIVFKGGDGTDSVIYDASKDTTGRHVDVYANGLTAGVTFDQTEGSLGVESAENTVVLTGSGADTIHVAGTHPSLPITLDGGDGNDTARVGTQAAGLAALHGDFYFNGSGGDDALEVNDAASTGGSVTGIDDGGLRHGGGTARPVSGVEHSSFTAGSGADSIAKASGVPWAIDSGPGDDAVATRDAVADTVSCGEGADFAVTDPLDALSAGCERSDQTKAGTDGNDGGGSAGGDGTSSPSTPGPDTTPPAIGVSGLPKSRVRLRSLLRGLRPRLSADEPAAFQVQLLGSVRRVALARSYDLTLARAALPIGTGNRSVRLKPQKRLVRRARRFTVRAVITATDAAGNRSTVTKTLKVR